MALQNEIKSAAHKFFPAQEGRKLAQITRRCCEPGLSDAGIDRELAKEAPASGGVLDVPEFLCIQTYKPFSQLPRFEPRADFDASLEYSTN